MLTIKREDEMVDVQLMKVGRRVVTGLDVNGKSTILMDGPVPPNAVDVDPGRVVNWVWRENEIPTSLEGSIDHMESFNASDWASQSGVLFGLFKWEPGAEYPMHATPTADVLFVLSGNIELILDSDSTVLGPGDCLVQRGTRHAWRVVGETPLVMAGIAIERKPE